MFEENMDEATELRMYAVRAPNGRCLLLAKALADVSLLSDYDCLILAQELYQNRYDRESPAILPLKKGSEPLLLMQICAESGIVAELLDLNG